MLEPQIKPRPVQPVKADSSPTWVGIGMLLGKASEGGLQTKDLTRAVGGPCRQGNKKVPALKIVYSGDRSLEVLWSVSNTYTGACHHEALAIPGNDFM